MTRDLDSECCHYLLSNWGCFSPLVKTGDAQICIFFLSWFEKHLLFSPEQEGFLTLVKWLYLHSFLGCRWNLKSWHLYLCSAETFAPSLNIEAIQLFSHMIELSNRKNLITWYEWLVWVMEQFWATALNRCSALNSGIDLIVSIYLEPRGLISFSMLKCWDRVF